MGILWSRPLPPRPAALSARVVVVTGCDTGFGHLLALRLDKLGYRVVALCLTAGGVDALRDKLSGAALVLQADVTSADDVARVRAELEHRFPAGVYGLVNNAGISLGGPIEWTPLDSFRRVMDVNFFGYVAMIKALAPLLRRAYGRVVNVASVAGFAAAPNMAAYAASKHAVEALTDSLRVEMAPFGVAVTAIEPFFMRTPILNGIGEMPKLYNALPQEMQDVWGPDVLKNFDEAQKLLDEIAGDPAQVVDTIVDALQCRWPAPLPVRMARFLPSWVADSLHYYGTRYRPVQGYNWFRR